MFVQGGVPLKDYGDSAAAAAAAATWPASSRPRMRWVGRRLRGVGTWLRVRKNIFFLFCFFYQVPRLFTRGAHPLCKHHSFLLIIAGYKGGSAYCR